MAHVPRLGAISLHNWKKQDEATLRPQRIPGTRATCFTALSHVPRRAAPCCAVPFCWLLCDSKAASEERSCKMTGC